MSSINQYLSLAEFESIVFGNSKAEVSAEVLERVKLSFEFLKDYIKEKSDGKKNGE